MSPQHPADPGLQPERTALAWRRTAFALAIGALVSFRVLAPTIGAWSVLPAALGLTVAAAILVSSHRRYRHHFGALSASGNPDSIETLTGGGLMALTAGVVMVFGLTGLVFALASALTQSGAP